MSERAPHRHRRWVLRVLALAGSSEPSPEVVETLGEGWVAEEALAISLYCALSAKDFLSGVLLAINHSGDSDSTGSMTGNLLGARWGVESLPEGLLEELEGREVIRDIAEDLHSHFVEGQSLHDIDRYPTW